MDILITGGAGFIGCNVARYFRNQGCRVHIFDNLSRKGTSLNLASIEREFPGVEYTRGDVRDAEAVRKTLHSRKWDGVIHLAGQVAVTTSVQNPREDFEINALGTFNVLEGVRTADCDPLVIYSSTNKVYGGMEDVVISKEGDRYILVDFPRGIDETRQLDFHSPYGCSKGAADQYCIDYSRIYGISSVVFRQSCIYGRNQYGIEDQGWVAWFTIAAFFGAPITVYGDGCQVRDVLYADDLAHLYYLALTHREKITGQAYNVGGGPDMTMSLQELLDHLRSRLDRDITPDYADWRPGDQKVYISDIRRIEASLGWKPSISIAEGVDNLVDFCKTDEQNLRSLQLI